MARRFFIPYERATIMVLLYASDVAISGRVWFGTLKDKSFYLIKKEDIRRKMGVTVLIISFGQEFDQYAQRKT